MRINDQIDYIIARFDFKTVHEHLKQTRAKIKLSDGQEVIPTIENLITLATYCLTEASVNKKEAFSYSGFDAYFQNNVLELNYSLSRVNTLEVIFG